MTTKNSTRKFALFAAPFLLCAAAQAAAINTTMTVTSSASGAVTGTSITATGSATLTNIGTGTFTATLSLITYTAPYTITFSNGSLTGVITTSGAILSGAASGSATVTSGTGAYAGATGTFPSLAGTGSLGATGNINLGFTGNGTINTSGGGTTGPGAPTISGVVNNYSFIQPGFPNSGIAPSTLFVVTGTGMADPNAQAVLQDSSKVLPTTLNGASISVTSGGVTVHPAFYYAIAGQLAAVLPANTPAGTATITVSYNNVASAPFTFQVVAAAPGIGTYGGLAIATNATDYSLYSYTKSAKPGDVIVLWGSGLGSTGDSDTTFTSAPHPANTSSVVYIGGIQAASSPYYAGSSGYPGLDQIDAVVPANVQPGCNVSVVIVSGTGANAVTSNVASLAVAPNGGGCSDSAFGTSGATSQTLSGKSTVKIGGVFLLHSASAGSSFDVAESSFQSVSGSSFSSSGSQASIGSCTLLQTVGATGTTGTTTGLNAGTITVSGPVSTVTLAALPGGTSPGISFAQLAAGFIPSSGGAFTFKGTGGSDVGSFTTTVNFPNPLLTWSNTAAGATISRASGVDVSWTGGASGTYVQITGSSANASGANASFTCSAPVSAGTFHVPSYITLSMPAGSGSLAITNFNNYQSFTATGIDFGYAFGGSNQSINSTYN